MSTPAYEARKQRLREALKLSRAASLRLDNLTVINLPLSATRALAEMVDRNLELQCRIQDGQMWMAGAQDTVHIEPTRLFPT